ncbi:restriction endonuclease subunit S [candidate division KSB1 bacterium]|nr:MAG: restriction endonuclease subunit S [candidate division KSB1 bacterium]MBC6949282.1 restriction endonuclease subunit S [candidate division KSB1 bacterium]MCE7945097.1 restriction endonuclease subunit S [Chlorobi bacterium CHB1]MDL1874239.1 restriction endonuclease subunit S [Cytophagia bacterium CHB2]
MEMKPGYKQTEVGLIPEDWDVTTVGNEFSIQLGKMLDSEKNVGVPKSYLGNRAVQWGRIDLNDLGVIRMTPSDLQRFRLLKGDLLVCEGGEIGRAAIWNEPIAECYYQKALHRLRPIRGYKVQLMLNVLQRLASTGYLTNFVTQTSIAHLPKDKFEKVPIPRPSSLSEQEAIAEALSDADALIESLEQLIAKKRQIKQGAMQELLTGKKRLPEFSGEWEVKTLMDVCSSITDGTHFTPQYMETGIPFYSVENVTANNFADTKFISVKEHNQLVKRCKPEKGDILLTRIGAIGDTKLIDWDVEASIYVSLALLKVKHGIDSRYIHCYTKCRQFRLDIEERSLMNASPKKINMGEIGGVPIPLPELAEQTAIAAILSDMDAEIAALEAKLAKVRQLKQGMMQELLTGRVRLI